MELLYVSRILSYYDRCSLLHVIYVNHNILDFWIYFRFFHNFASRSPILMIFTFLKMALKFIEKKISGGGGIRTHEHQS